MSSSSPYPPPEARSRSILVRNISPKATSTAITEFFSFCGPVTSHRIRAVAPTASSATPTLEAVIIFADETVCADALVMDKSSIVDQPVRITRVPTDFDFSIAPDVHVIQQDSGMWGGFGAFGDLFAGVGSAVADEMGKASKMLDQATESGWVKSAKEGVVGMGKKTRELAEEVDDKWHVTNNLLNAAEVGKMKASQVATAVATQTKNVATEMDTRLHITENTGKLAQRAREVPAVNSGLMAMAGGWQSLLAQTGLSGDSGSSTLPAGESEANGRTAPPQETSRQ